MQIEKINENQLKVSLSVTDLKENNISIHSFMCNSTEYKILFSQILNFANEKIGFSLKNYEIHVDAFSVLIKSSFILIITRIPKTMKLHLSKKTYTKFTASCSLWITLDNFEIFCMFCDSLANNLNTNSSLYLLNNTYFLHIKTNNFKDYFKIKSIAYEFSSCVYNDDFVLDENAKLIIKASAIQTCKKYCV